MRWTRAFSHTALPCGTRRRGLSLNRQTGVAAVSPPTRNARPLQGGPGIFACGCQGGITHYTLPPCGGSKAYPGTPFAALATPEAGPDRPASCAPLPPFLLPVTGGRGVPLPAAKTIRGCPPKACGLLRERSNHKAVSFRRKAETISGVHCDERAGRRTKNGGYYRNEDSACDSSQTLSK